MYGNPLKFEFVCVAILVASCEARSPQETNPDDVMAPSEQTPLSSVCTESERMDYVLAKLDRFSEHWDDLGGRSEARCEIKLSLSRNGEVTASEFQECPEDAALRELLLTAVERAQPFPEPPNPTCFAETFDISVGRPRSSD